MFDGAAASAADQHHQGSDDASAATAPASTADPASRAPASAAPVAASGSSAAPTPAPAAPAPTLNLVVVDSRVEGREQLTAKLPDNSRLLVIDTQTDGLAAISAALAELGHVDSIQIFSHGGSGQFTLGSRTLSSDNIDAAAGLLEGWRAELQPGADIQLYGCNVGSGAAGQALVSELAHLTGADVGASIDNTGSTTAGGNWSLEVRSGDVDKTIALAATSVEAYQGLLADATPTVSFANGPGDVLLGSDFTFTVNFTNPSTQIGYAPYIDLFFPATGKDGDDGATFVSASYLGQSLTAIPVTFDAAGNATHPLWRDANGNPVVITAASVGMQPGDQMVVVVLPYGSVSSDQPVIPINVTAHLSELADTNFSNGAPDLGIRVRGGFQFGNDSLNNPAQDPTMVGTFAPDLTVHPTILTFTRTIDTVEGETATGPNFPHTLTVTATPAPGQPPGQTLENVTVKQTMSPDVVVTGITPAAGGTITSLTLVDGSVVTDPLDIALLLATGTYLQDFTVTYPTVDAPTATSVTFYVANFDADGNPVIDSNGNPVNVTIGGATATGSWTPLDPRDLVPPATDVDFTSTGPDTTFVARSLSLHKESSVAVDTGTPGMTPGDTLNYRLDIHISDYFAFGQDFFFNGTFAVTDQLGDGQTLVGTPMLAYTYQGNAGSVPLVYTAVTNADGTTTLVFDIVATVQTIDPTRRALDGDLANNGVRNGPTTGVITYQATVGQSYTPPTGAPHSEINEGDPVGNNAEVSATVLDNLLTNTGVIQRDTSNSTATVPTSAVEIELTEVNGATPPANAELSPGDLVTFRLSYDLVTSDYEQFRLTAYLPPPLLSTAGVAWTVGSGAGQWQLTGGNTNLGPAPTVTSGPGNSVIFDFGSYAVNAAAGSRIELEFTLSVSDQPYADGRSLAVLGQSQQTTTLDHALLVTSDITNTISVAEPILAIRHGVVSTSHGTVSGITTTTVTWAAPGSTGPAFTGAMTDLAFVDGRVDGIDASDLLRLATAIENTGGGAAFDVVTSITLPPGLSFFGGSLSAANLQIRRGDGTLLAAGTDYSVNNATNTITFLDPGGAASLLAGRAGTTADATGANMVVITYDVVVNAAIDASRTMQSTATLSNYAGVDTGPNFIPTPLTENADQQVAAPTVAKFFAGGTLDNGDSSATHTTGSDLVIGESMLYDIVVTLPEGVTQSLSIDDLIPLGLRLDTTFNGVGYQIITNTADSGALGANFNGAVIAGTFTGISGGALGDDGVGAQLTLASSSAQGDNDTGNNSFVLRIRLVASNTLDNQQGRSLPNNARLNYSDPDGNVSNGTVATPVVVALTGGQPTVTVREPTLVITQTTATDPGIGVDEGDTVEFVITISNGSAGSDFNAFDILFVDDIPTELANLQLLGVTYAGGATNNGLADFAISGSQLISLSGSNIDIPTGGSIVLRFSGVVTAQAASQAVIDNPIRLQWTSLNGTNSAIADPAGERTGNDGVLNGGTLNDYQRLSNLLVPVAQAIRISRIGGLPETPFPADGTNAPVEQVTIGEVIRYRVAVLVPEGDNPNYELRITLPVGLDFIDPVAFANTVRLAFVSNGALTSDRTDLVTGGTLAVNGDEDSAIALYITPDLSGPAPDGVFNPNYVTVSADGRTVSFSLGNLRNQENDANLEGVVFEFNVRVTNVASNQSTSPLLGVSAHEFVNNLARANSETVSERVVEPGFAAIDKRVIGFDPNPAGATGTATVQLSFTSNGGLPAFDTRVTDAIPNGSNYTLLSVIIDGTTFAPGALPAGVTVDTTTGIVAGFDQLNPGQSVRIVYQVTLPNTAAIAVSNATMTWTSLPDDFTSWGGSAVGTPAGSTIGERTGSENPAVNDYVLREGAGLGVIRGTLWNDTASATTSTAPDGPGLSGQTVTLIWSGLDNTLGTGDDATFTTITDALGQYQFALLPAGNFRVDTPTGTITYPQPVGDLRVRIDTDGGTLGQIVVTLGESQSTQANAGYVEQNDAPVNNMPASVPDGLEDEELEIHGITVSDIDVDRDPVPASRTMQITLSVTQGTLFLSAAQPGVTVTGANTATMVLTGTLADLNAALDRLMYLGRQDFNGTDTLTVLTSDLGNFGDFNGNGIPGELADARTDQDQITLTLEPVNDAPIANPDTADSLEAGGTFNQQSGINPRGGLLGNDTDVDIATNGDSIRVSLIGAGGVATEVVPLIGLAAANGQFGQLVVDSDGIFQYILDNNNTAVQALRLSSQTLTETFTYVIIDEGGLTATSTLTVTIHGANDAPVGFNDTGIATEAGGVANGTAGADATGFVLANDTDVDSVANGETRQVTGIRALPENVPGRALVVAAGTNSTTGTRVVGNYGTLTIGSDGSYRYVVNNALAAVQALAVGDTLTETFSYRLTDTDGLNDVAELTITIQGAQDNPVATDNSAVARAAPTDNSQPEVNPSGNVITDNNGNGVDSDVDAVDNPNTVLRVNGIRGGTEAAGGALAGVTTTSTSASGATTLQGQYGTLTIGGDGSYTYNVDSSNIFVQALGEGESLQDIFTYRLVDTAGLTDLAQLVVRVDGVNDPPAASDFLERAIEASGRSNTTPGLDPAFTTRSAVVDPDGDPITVISVRVGLPGGPGIDVPVTPGADTIIDGNYGTLTVRADATFEYAVHNLDPRVQALLLDTDILLDFFTYTVADPQGLSGQGALTLVVHGRNDDPVAANDAATAVEAGGTLNQTLGIDPTGNVFDNDTDVDDNDQMFVFGARAGAEAAGGIFTGMLANASITVRGTYGSLVIFENGNYQYLVDNNNAQVQALKPGETLTESFTYAMRDLALGADFAQLDVTIGGAWDAPVAENNFNYAVADNPFRTALNPTGNLITDNSIFGIPYPADSDVDNGDVLSVSSVRAGPESAGSGGMTSIPTGSTAANSGVRITGQYGWLTVGADGSYLYEVDSSNPTILALGPLGFVTDQFTYEAQDLGGLTDLAQLTVLVRGVNQAPVPAPDRGDAVEAGGDRNALPGKNLVVDADHGVLANDFDFEGDDLFVVGIRPGDLSGGAANTGVGTVLQGQYGTLTMQRDGSWTYEVDNDSPEVEALRITGQTLTDVFTYTVTDFPWGARANAELRVVIDGRNDNPIANDDGNTAVEAGGVANATPGVDPIGNVLDNDTDVDSVANGETKQVLTVSHGATPAVTAGTLLQATYGTLQLNADGSYTYVVDNDNAAVQALRTRDETLTEVFVYTMRDTEGAESTASLTITLRGANDNPVARDDSGSATDQVPAPQTSGNVLPNDSDVDGGDALQVVGIRAGAENVSGAAGSLDQPLAGRYGTLVIHADGSYTYTIDQTNPEVLAAAGVGQVLNDFFTYTVADRLGATDQAQLVIHLDIAAPYIGPEGDQIFGRNDRPVFEDDPLPRVRPAVFVEPVVRQVDRGLEISSWGTDGTRTLDQLPREIVSTSIGAGLGEVAGQFVARPVAESRIDREFSMARLLGRESRVDLSADHLLPDPSLFTIDPADMLYGASDDLPSGEARELQTASSFSEQLRAAARERQAMPMARPDKAADRVATR